MKKIIYFVLTAFFAVGFWACSEDSDYANQGDSLKIEKGKEDNLGQKRKESIAMIRNSKELSKKEKANLISSFRPEVQAKEKAKMVDMLKEEGIDPEWFFSLSVKDIIANLPKEDEVKGKEEKATPSQCQRARDSYVKRLGSSLSVLSTYDLLLLQLLCREVSGSPTFASRDQLIDEGGLTYSQARSICRINFTSSNFVTTADLGDIRDAILGRCND